MDVIVRVDYMYHNKMESDSYQLQLFHEERHMKFELLSWKTFCLNNFLSLKNKSGII